MVVSKDFILIHLQKCGGTFIRTLMERHFGCNNIKPEHSGVSALRPNHKDRLLVGTIRNPWSWYVSLYSKHNGNPNSFMKDTFKDNPTFSQWLVKFLNEDRKLHDLDFNIIQKHGIGPYTYRMLRCYTTNGGLNPNLIDNRLKIIKTEGNLSANFIKVLEDNGVKVGDDIKNKILSTDKIHTSNHGHYSEYYTDETIELVRQKDKIIIDKFNYNYQHE